MIDTSGGEKVFGRANVGISGVSDQSARNPSEKPLPVASGAGIQRAPWVSAAIKPGGGSETVHGRNQIAECIVPGAPFVTVEGLIVSSIEAAAQIAPISHRKAQLYVFWIERKRDQAGAGKVLVLVEF